jgi:hypothetical protein
MSKDNIIRNFVKKSLPDGFVLSADKPITAEDLENAARMMRDEGYDYIMYEEYDEFTQWYSCHTETQEMAQVRYDIEKAKREARCQEALVTKIEDEIIAARKFEAPKHVLSPLLDMYRKESQKLNKFK